MCYKNIDNYGLRDKLCINDLPAGSEEITFCCQCYFSSLSEYVNMPCFVYLCQNRVAELCDHCFFVRLAKAQMFLFPPVFCL